MYYSDDATLEIHLPSGNGQDAWYAEHGTGLTGGRINVLASGVLGPNGCFAGTVAGRIHQCQYYLCKHRDRFSNVSGSGNFLANQWQWTVTPSAGVTISSPNAASTDISFPTAGTYMVELTASNSGSQVRTFQNIQVTACQLLDCRKNQQKWIFGWGYSGVDFSSGSPATYIPPTNFKLNDGNQESYYVETDPQTGNVLLYADLMLYDGSFNKINTTSFHPLASLGGTYNSSAQIIIIPFRDTTNSF